MNADLLKGDYADPLIVLQRREARTCAGCNSLVCQEWLGIKKFVCRVGKQKGSTDINEMRRCRAYAETGRNTVGVKEKIVSAAQSKDLAWEADFEKAIDRLTAFGMSDPLGAALWRFKYLHDRSAYAKAHALLVKKAGDRLRGKEEAYIRGLAVGAIIEWALENCSTCNGTGVISQNNRPTLQCTKCGGSGLKKYSDWERSNNCGLHGTWNAGHQKNFDEVMICLMGATAATGGKVRDLLKNPN